RRGGGSRRPVHDRAERSGRETRQVGGADRRRPPLRPRPRARRSRPARRRARRRAGGDAQGRHARRGAARPRRRRLAGAPRPQGRHPLPRRGRASRGGLRLAATPVAKHILINVVPWEARAALLEDTTLVELHIERGREPGIAGNIYKGKVVRVLPGMQAAFVDIGLEKAAFLHASDIPGEEELPPTLAQEGEVEAAERDRLRVIVEAERPPEGGFIVRTACEGVTKREIHDDVRFLSRLWGLVHKQAAAAGAPALIHQDLDLVLRVVRDLFTSDVERLTVDSPEEHARVLEFVKGLMPRLAPRVHLYEGVTPRFEQH